MVCATTARAASIPARFFDELRRQMPDDAIAMVDDGNHTYLTAELSRCIAAAALIVPTDFNCMGYAVPAAVGAKLSRPGARCSPSSATAPS